MSNKFRQVCPIFFFFHVRMLHAFLITCECGRGDGITMLSKAPFTQSVNRRKLPLKLLECLVCERKHIPGWGPGNIAGICSGTCPV